MLQMYTLYLKSDLKRVFCTTEKNAHHLSGKDPTYSDDDQDVEDCRAHNGAHPHISFSDEHT